MSAPLITLSPESVDAIAERVAELLAHCEIEHKRAGSTAPELVDAAEIARRLGVSRDYLYAHADELGAVRSTPKGLHREQFEDAFKRYIPRNPHSYPPQRHNGSSKPDEGDSYPPQEIGVADRKPPQTASESQCGAVADTERNTREKGGLTVEAYVERFRRRKEVEEAARG